MNIPWDDLKLFLAVAETGSLSSAARRLRVAQPTVSRRLAALEAAVGEPLFARGVDGARPTALGERLLEPARRMAEWAVEVERAAEQPAAPAGVVRLTAAPGTAYELAAPFAAWLRSELPDVTLEVVSTVQYLDLARREADLALRSQKPSQKDLLCLASLSFEAVPCAARSYAEKLPRRARLRDVGWIAWAPPLDHVTPNPELARLIPGFRPVFASDDYLVQVRACEVGLGAMFFGRIRHRFERPTPLVELDLDFAPVPAGLHLVCARSALAVPRIRAVAERLAAELERADTRPPRRR